MTEHDNTHIPYRYTTTHDLGHQPCCLLPNTRRLAGCGSQHLEDRVHLKCPTPVIEPNRWVRWMEMRKDHVPLCNIPRAQLDNLERIFGTMWIRICYSQRQQYTTCSSVQPGGKTLSATQAFRCYGIIRGSKSIPPTALIIRASPASPVTIQPLLATIRSRETIVWRALPSGAPG